MRHNLQHAIERVGRPGGSHEGVGRKKSTVFVISVTRPRSEWFPRTMPLRAGDSSPCCATNARCSWKVKISHVCSKEIEIKSLDSLGICQITPGTSLNVFLGLTNCIWHRPRNVRRRKSIIERNETLLISSRDGPISTRLPTCF